MRRLAICAALLGVLTFAGGAGLAAKSEGAVPRRWMDSRLGKLVMGRAGRAMTLQSELNLTDAQREAVKNAIKPHKKELAGAAKLVVERKRALRELVLAEVADESAIRKAAGDLGVSIGDAAILAARVKGEIKANANLSPEQMKKLSDFRAANDAAIDEFLNQPGAAE